MDSAHFKGSERADQREDGDDHQEMGGSPPLRTSDEQPLLQTADQTDGYGLNAEESGLAEPTDFRASDDDVIMETEQEERSGTECEQDSRL